MIIECDKEVEKVLLEITADIEDIKVEGKRKPIRYNRPCIENLHQPLLKMTEGKDPIGIAGITDYSFLQIVSEIGVDMSAWKAEKQFISWLKLAPLKNKPGKISKKVAVKRTNKASLIFRTISEGLLTSKYLALGSFGRRIKAKRGSGVAIKAMARKIACYYYRVMTKGVDFVEKGIIQYEEQQKLQQKKYLEKLALKFNMKLVPVS